MKPSDMRLFCVEAINEDGEELILAYEGLCAECCDVDDPRVSAEKKKMCIAETLTRLEVEVKRLAKERKPIAEQHADSPRSIATNDGRE